MSCLFGAVLFSIGDVAHAASIDTDRQTLRLGSTSMLVPNDWVLDQSSSLGVRAAWDADGDDFPERAVVLQRIPSPGRVTQAGLAAALKGQGMRNIKLETVEVRGKQAVRLTGSLDIPDATGEPVPRADVAYFFGTSHSDYILVQFLSYPDDTEFGPDIRAMIKTIKVPGS